MPTVSVYTSPDNEIFEIRITFDDHGYQERFYIQFRGLCSCLLKMACPELAEEEIVKVFEALYSLAYDSFFGNHHAYGDPARPPLSKLFCYENIGFYCFYGSGNIEICMIPLTALAMELLEKEGVEVQKIQDTLISRK